MIRSIQFHGGFHLACLGVAAVVGVAAGMGLEKARSLQPMALTELTAARTLAGSNVRLIGWDCGDHRATVLTEYEDEFPEKGCARIEKLTNAEM